MNIGSVSVAMKKTKIDINEVLKKQNSCEHKNIVRVDSVVIGHYFQCQDCLKISASSTYFKHYEEE